MISSRRGSLKTESLNVFFTRAIQFLEKKWALKLYIVYWMYTAVIRAILTWKVIDTKTWEKWAVWLCFRVLIIYYKNLISVRPLKLESYQKIWKRVISVFIDGSKIEICTGAEIFSDDLDIYMSLRLVFNRKLNQSMQQQRKLIRFLFVPRLLVQFSGMGQEQKMAPVLGYSLII